MGERISADRFGKDHWSLVLYLGSCDDGRPDPVHMRTNPRTHTAYAVTRRSVQHDTRTTHGKVEDHDDWDCADDLVAAGLSTRHATSSKIPAYRLTPDGQALLSRLRAWKASHRPLDQFGVRAPTDAESAA